MYISSQNLPYMSNFHLLEVMKCGKNEMHGVLGHLYAHKSYKLGEENLLRMVRWMTRHCPPDTGIEIILARARYLSVTEAPRNIESLRVSAIEAFCFFWNLKAREGFEPEISDFPSRQLNYSTKAPAPWIAVARHNFKCVKIYMR